MENLLHDLHDALEKLSVTPLCFPPSEEERLLLDRVQSILRIIYLCIPAERIKDGDIKVHMKRVLGIDPTDEILAFAKRMKRGGRIELASRLDLEAKQNSRCALCGSTLSVSSEPHVDHKQPIVYGGSSALSNLQLLCGSCNLGKSSSIHWVMLQPFFDEAKGEPSTKMRYAALRRFNGRCSVEGCSNTSYFSKLHVSHVIPVQEGGRTIFDNLTVLCGSHNMERTKKLQSKALAAVNGGSAGAFGFSFG